MLWDPTRVEGSIPGGNLICTGAGGGNYILGASFFRDNSSVISIGVSKGFHPSLGSPWVPFQPRSTAIKQSWDTYREIQLASDNPSPRVPLPLSVPSLPTCSVGQAGWEDDGTLQRELRLSQPVGAEGLVGIEVEGYVHGPQPSERQLVLIQLVAKYDTDSGAVVGMASGVEWCKPGTPSYCKVVNTGRAPAVVRSGHPIAKVIGMNVSDEDRFRALLVHSPPLPANPFLEPTAQHLPPAPDAGADEIPLRGAELSEADIGQLSGGAEAPAAERAAAAEVAGLFPEDPKRVHACTARELRVPLI